MKVLFNIYPVAFACPGGGEMQLLNTKNALEKNGIEVILYDIWNPQFDNADVVHFFSVQGGVYNFCYYVYNIGIPLVISPIIWLGRDKNNYPLGEMGEMLKRCSQIFPNSVAEQKLLEKEFNLEKSRFHVTNNAVSEHFILENVHESFSKKYNLEDPFLLNVANIEERKNQLNLIKALKNRNKKLILIGNIRDEDYFNRCMEEGKGFVKHIGYLNNDDPILISAYKECELFILPSLLETPGLSALEAAACGAKIVITEIGCTKEYFEGMVTYVDPYNIQNIYNGIKNELSIERDGSISDKVVNKFTWDNTAKQCIEGYKKAIEMQGNI